jgi:hypothetical protein
MTTLLDCELRWRPDHRAEQQVRSVPVDVPQGVAGLEVELAYERGDGAVVDLGMEGPEGYVGWSGGARRRVLVTAEWATPGYVQTPVIDGTWQVLLGLHRVPRDGVAVRLTVRAARASDVERHRVAEPADPPPASRTPHERPSLTRELPTLDGLRWLAGDFHAHTVHSDGVLSPGGLAALAATRGLDFIAVTDHNTVSHHPHLPGAGAAHGILLLPGQELTRDTGHANAFGDTGFVDFRLPQSSWAAAVAARGGVFSINHPLATDCAWLGEVADAQVAEVWHSSWAQVRSWGAPLAWWLLTPGTTPIGGSDYHHDGSDAPPGEPTTWVLCDGDDVLGGVRAGRTAVSASVDGPLLLRHGDELVAIDADGLLLTGPERGRRCLVGDVVRVPAEPGPWWLEDDNRVVHALTR